MQWSEQAIILGSRAHGETSAIVQVLTRGHGRHSGLVRGARSRRLRPVLQQGNLVSVNWRARLEDHLGNFSIEPLCLRAASWMTSPFKLAGLVSLTTMCTLLPEREPHARLYDASLLLLDHLDDDHLWPAMLVRWEAGLLEELGFGLDLSRCAATGSVEELSYVSPKTGRAVSRIAGAAWADKLLDLPPFLVAAGKSASNCDVITGLKLTGYFLKRHVFEPRDLALPEARTWIIRHLQKATSA